LLNVKISKENNKTKDKTTLGAGPVLLSLTVKYFIAAIALTAGLAGAIAALWFKRSEASTAAAA
jgi:uncharacterized membrane protein